jgi:nucleotide-binding universal stress UspA family protein
MTVSINRMLVPLDGSQLAEIALHRALPLAARPGGRITLLRVVEPIGDIVGMGIPPMYLDDLLASYKKKAVQYLRSVAERPEFRKLKVRTVVSVGQPADQIIKYARANPKDFIVMSTHGRSGFKRWMFGSTAEKVLRGANSPVLLVRASPNTRAGKPSRTRRRKG